MNNPTVKVLLIEDKQDEARLVRQMLKVARASEFALVHVNQLAKGLRYFVGGEIDLILLDLMLPDSQGLETLQQVRAQAPEAAVVVMTDMGSAELAREALQVGAQDYLIKGQFNADTLVRAMRYALERQRLLVELERRTQESESRERNFRKAIATNADGIVLMNQQGVIIFANPSVENIFGLKAADLRGVMLGIPSAAGETTELDVLRSDGANITVEMRVVETEWEGEVAYLAALRDITERKRMEEALQASEKRFRALIEHSADAIALVDATGKVIYASPSAARIRGVTPQEMIGTNGFAGIQPDDLTAARALFAQVMQNPGVPFQSELRFRRSDGSWRWLEATVTNQLNEAGIEAIVGNYRDIQDRKLAEQELRDSERLFRALIEHSADAVALTAANGAILYASSSTVRVLGYDANEIIGRKISTLMHPDDAPRIAARCAELLNQPGCSLVAQWRMSHQEGSWRWLECVFTNLLHEPGVQAMVINYRDISERIEAEAQIRRMNEELEQRVIERTAELEAANREPEAFSYSVSHDLRAPRRAIDGFARILQESEAAQLSPEEQQYLQRVVENAAQMSQLIQALLTFSRLSRQAICRQRVDPAELIARAKRCAPNKTVATWNG